MKLLQLTPSSLYVEVVIQFAARSANWIYPVLDVCCGHVQSMTGWQQIETELSAELWAHGLASRLYRISR